ncbi:MAG: hypothetical protein P8X50_16360 [Maritimibacter sp.]
MKLITDLSLTSARRNRGTWLAAYAVNGTKPVLVADYRGNVFGTTARSDFGSLHSFSRPSNAWGYDANGMLASFTADEPRLISSLNDGIRLGLLLEPGSQNKLPSPAMTGMATGALSSGGALPTGWSTLNIASSAVTVTDITPLSGLPRIRLQISGTPTSGDVYVFFSPRTEIVASAGQSWAASAFLALSGGSFSNVSNIRFYGIGWTASGGFVSGSTVNFNGTNLLTSITDNLERQSFIGSLSEAASERLQIGLRLDTSGSIDFTLDIALAQLEQGSIVSSPTPSSTARADETIGLSALNGTYDLRAETASGSVSTFLAQAVTPGYWPPALASGTLRSMIVYPAGTL